MDSEVWIYSMATISWFNFVWFFLWDYIKNIVHKTPPTSAGDMKNRLMFVIAFLKIFFILTVENFEKDWSYVCKKIELYLNILSMVKDIFKLILP